LTDTDTEISLFLRNVVKFE